MYGTDDTPMETQNCMIKNMTTAKLLYAPTASRIDSNEPFVVVLFVPISIDSHPLGKNIQP